MGPFHQKLMPISPRHFSQLWTLEDFAEEKEMYSIIEQAQGVSHVKWFLYTLPKYLKYKVEVKDVFRAKSLAKLRSHI